MGRRRRGTALPTAALLAVLAAAALPLASAVICESYRTSTECKGKVTDSGYCGWSEGGCHAVKPLPEGVFAIASVDEDAPVSSAPPKPAAAAAAPAPAPAPAPEAAGRHSRHMLQTIVVRAFSDPTAAAGPVPAAPAATPPGPCDDVLTPEGFTCAQQAGWGKCSEPWMLGGGFCRATCGLCKAMPAAAGGQPAAEQAEGPTDAAFCTQPPERGPCRAAVPSWFFDAGMGECRPFLYGGCQGNENRFDSFDACAEAAARFCVV
ncbi:hypothetical protein ABPG75_010095 [Micractinium tetrahymenae]